MRPLHAIARDIRAHWPNISPHAKPYLSAMATLDSPEENYGADTGKSVVRYFLANAGSWRGEHARAIKRELKEMVA